MTEKLEDRCKRLIFQHEYKECEKKLGEAMLQNPHSAIPHNLMGILMEKENNHIPFYTGKGFGYLVPGRGASG